MAKYIVFIPKYEFTIEKGAACKKYSDDSLSVSVEATSERDAVFKTLLDLGIDRLSSSGYAIDNIKAELDYGGSSFIVTINGVKDLKHGR